jgi:hypothetical protein
VPAVQRAPAKIAKQAAPRQRRRLNHPHQLRRTKTRFRFRRGIGMLPMEGGLEAQATILK